MLDLYYYANSVGVGISLTYLHRLIASAGGTWPHSWQTSRLVQSLSSVERYSAVVLTPTLLKSPHRLRQSRPFVLGFTRRRDFGTSTPLLESFLSR